MANKNLGTAQAVTSILKTNSVLVEVGGSIRRITLDNFLNSVNQGDEQMLRMVAWGIPIKQSEQSSTNWGRIGNLAAWDEYKFYCGRYLVKNDGTAAKLSRTNSAVYADGTTLDETKGHVMWIGPRLYYRVQNDAVSGMPVLWLSMLPIGGDYIGTCNGGQYNCIGAYKGYVSGSALVSRSGVAPTGSRSITSFWNAAQANGEDWGLVNYDHRRLFMMLGLSEYGDTNIQAKLGYGVGGSQSMDLWAAAAGLLTGATKANGDASVKIPTSVSNGGNTGKNCSRVSFLGLEDLWGWQWEMTQGVYFGNSANDGAQDGTEIFIYDGNRMPTAAELSSHPTGSYRQLTRKTGTAFIQEMILGEKFDIFTSKLGGGSTSYWSDQFWGSTTGQLCLWGGSAYDGALCGLACAYSYNAFSNSHAHCGSRLAYFGELNFVNGKQI